jgi:Putative prokaryotic signal transducing protein
VKRVFSSYNLAAVHHARNVLDAAGIRALVKNQYLSSAMGDLPPAECQPELWVLHDADAARAEELLFTGEAPGEPWKCHCGEMLGGQFTQCWQCGSYRPTEAARS